MWPTTKLMTAAVLALLGGVAAQDASGSWQDELISECTAVDTPTGCVAQECTGVGDPYDGCLCTAAISSNCTARNCEGNTSEPYVGCIVADCTENTVTPYEGCIVADCTESIITPYEGCNVADCTTSLSTPYEGCNEVICTLPSACDADTQLCTNGYNLTGSVLDRIGFDYNATCTDGYARTADGPLVAACTTSGPFILQGCVRLRPPPVYVEATLRLPNAEQIVGLRTTNINPGDEVQWDDLDKKAAFESTFKTSMAEALGVSENRITQITVTVASASGRRLQTGTAGVDVNFRLEDTYTGAGTSSAQAMNELQAQIELAEVRGTPFAIGDFSVDTSTFEFQVLRDGDPVEWGDPVTVAESYYEIDWDNDVRPGQSLEYIETPQEDVPLCTCDLTNFICDITPDGGCRCDPDCLEFLPAEGIGSLPEGTIEKTVTYCADLDSANVETHALGVATLDEEGFTLSKEFEENQLCVIRTNSPSLGNFYTDPGKAIYDSPSSITSSVTADHIMRIDIDAGDYSSETETYTFATKSDPFVEARDFYAYGDALLAHNEDDECFAGTPHLILPSTGLDGACSDETGTYVGQSESSTACVRRPASTLEESCAYAFSAKPYIGRPDDDKTRCFRAQPDATGHTKVSIKVRQHYGTEDYAPHCFQSSCGPETIPETRYDDGSNVCKNAVAKVQYTVIHNGRGTVDDVVVELWYTDATETFIEQQFGVQYVMKSVFEDFDTFAEVSKDTATKERVERSGSPGYVPGAPVLFGREATYTYGDPLKTKYAVEEREGGMAVVGMGYGGRCLGGAQQVKYGHDAVGACNVGLNRDDLQAACESQGPGTTLYTPLFNSSDFVIGVFGDSDPTRRAEWVKLEQEGDVPTGDWVCPDQLPCMCQRLVTGLSVTIYTAAVGNELQPQNKIVGAYFSYVTTSVRFDAPSEQVEQGIELRNVVTFVELPDRIMKEQVLAAPRIIPTMPADFFYPFTLSTSGSTPNGGVPLLVVLTMCLLMARS